MISITGEQLNWLFTEHMGTTEQIKRGKPQLLCRSRAIKLGLSRLCSATFEQLSGLEQLFAVLITSSNFEQNISLEHILSLKSEKKKLINAICSQLGQA